MSVAAAAVMNACSSGLCYLKNMVLAILVALARWVAPPPNR
jgi:hypothetical protein